MDSIALRIKELIEFKKLNISSFEKKIGAGNNSIGTIINRNSNVSGQILSKILISFKDVSADWILTGNGEMLRDSSQNNKVVATGLNKNATDVIDVKMFAELCDKVDFIYTTTLKELAQNQLAGLKTDIENIKNEEAKKK